MVFMTKPVYYPADNAYNRFVTSNKFGMSRFSGRHPGRHFMGCAFLNAQHLARIEAPVSDDEKTEHAGHRSMGSHAGAKHSIAMADAAMGVLALASSAVMPIAENAGRYGPWKIRANKLPLAVSMKKMGVTIPLLPPEPSVIEVAMHFQKKEPADRTAPPRRMPSI